MKKGALLTSISMVLVTILAITTASFAWFTSSLTPSVGEFDLQATTANALFIGEKAVPSEWSTHLELANLSAAATTENNILPWDATTLTTDGGKTLMTATPAFGTGLLTQTMTAGADKAVYYKTDGMATPATSSPMTFWSRTDDAYAAGALASDNYKAVQNDGYAHDGAAGAILKDEPIHFAKFNLYFYSTYESTNGTDVFLNVNGKDSAGVEYDATKITAFEAYTADDGTNVIDTGTVDNDIINLKGLADDASGYMNISNYDAYFNPTNKAMANIVRSMRIAFIPAKLTVADGAVTAATPETPIIWEPDASDYKNDGNADFLPAGLISAGKDPRYTYATTAEAVGDATANNIPLFTIAKNETFMLTVYIWLEGNDDAASNLVTDAHFRVALNFLGEDAT